METTAAIAVKQATPSNAPLLGVTDFSPGVSEFEWGLEKEREEGEKGRGGF